MKEFETKRVVVTGAAGVLGKAVAQAFHAEGSDVVGVDTIEFEDDFQTVQLDLLDYDRTCEVVATLSTIDILANVAGGFTMGDAVADATSATWEAMLDINVRTTINMLRASVPSIRKPGGKIVNLGARAGCRGVATMAPYCASKSVVMRLTESLSDELKSEGVNVNCILPSIIDTPRNRQDMPNANFDSWVSPEALARVVMFLASTAADPIHGVSLPVEALS